MWVKRRLIPSLAAVALLVAMVLGHQKRFEARCQNLPKPGVLVPAAGGLVHVWCKGTGWPVVLMESSGLGNVTQYERVLNEVSKRTTACAWDRPDMGWSPGTTGGTTAPDQGERILTAITNMGKVGPIVAVGASTGGLISLYLARQHPERVVGLILIDAVTPEAVEAFHGSLTKLASSAERLAFAGRLGLLSLIDPLHLSEKDACLTYWPENFDAVSALVEGLPESARLVNKTPPLSPRMPLIVLRHGRPGDLVGAGASASDQKAAEPKWIALQQSLAAQSRAGRLRVVPQSGHLIAIEAPQAVVQAIDDVVDMTTVVRGQRPSACSRLGM
jgi:pimeloyl-ACP methyl ester carboxylesterase